MRGKMWLFAGVALAASAGGAWAQSPSTQPGAPVPGAGVRPAERLGAGGAPVLQNAAPDSASARQSALSGANVTTNPRAANGPSDNLIGEVIVTAEKREQSLQQVPVAVSAFTSEKRDLIGITSVVDQTNYTPGLTYTANNDRLSLRGVGRLTNAHSADSGTAIYVDGIFTTSTTQAGRSPLFVERTEILRGPQGTLYGRNAIGGAYNVISKRPTKDYSGEARVTLGNFDTQRVDAALSVPITDWLQTKFGFTKNHVGDGFLQNVVSGRPDENGLRDETYYEFQAQAQLGKLDLWFYYGQNIWDNSASPGSPGGGSFLPPNTTPGTGATPSPTYCFGGAINCVFQGPAGNPVLATGDLRAVNRDTHFQNQLHNANATTLQATYHFKDFDIKYIGGWQRYDYKYEDDTDGTAVQSYQVPLSPTAPAITGVGANCFQLQALGRCSPATVVFGNENTYEEDEEFYSHEINIASTWDGPLQYIAGLYYYHEKFQYPQIGISHQPGITTPVGATGGAVAPNPLGQYFYTNAYSTVSSKAVFGQVDYKLFDTLKLTGGLRYTNDEKKVTEEERFLYYGDGTGLALNRYGSLSPVVDITALALGTATAAQLASQGGRQQGIVTPVTLDPVTGRYRRGLRDGSNAVTGTAGVEWAPDRRTLVYGKYSRGYKAFGFNSVVATAFSPFPYSNPEQMDAFEVGLKKDWTRRFQTNVTGFYDLYYDAQVPLAIQQGSAPAFTIFYNVPRSIIQGVELESIWQPFDRFNVLLTYAYLGLARVQGLLRVRPGRPDGNRGGRLAGRRLEPGRHRRDHRPSHARPEPEGQQPALLAAPQDRAQPELHVRPGQMGHADAVLLLPVPVGAVLVLLQPPIQPGAELGSDRHPRQLQGPEEPLHGDRLHAQRARRRQLRLAERQPHLHRGGVPELHAARSSDLRRGVPSALLSRAPGLPVDRGAPRGAPLLSSAPRTAVE